MRGIYVGILLCIGLNALYSKEQKIEFGNFGTVTLYQPGIRSEEVVLFISGDGGWNQGVVEMARALTSLDACVVGINIVHYLKQLSLSNEKCLYPAADFELLSKFIQKTLNLPMYIQPILVGYSSGATLAYATLVQAPTGTFKGAISMGFCPDLPLTKPLCRGNGLQSEPGPNGKGYTFLPAVKLATPWIAFQGQADQVCLGENTEKFVKQTQMAQMVLLPKVGHGFSVEKNWLPQFKKAFLDLTTQHLSQQPKNPQSLDVSDLPLVEVPAKGNLKDVFAVLVSGDGGWAGIDKELSGVLAQSGISVAGLNSLKYFWSKKTPQQLGKDCDRIIRYYMNRWKKSNVILIGYSLGADVMPFMVSRLSKEFSDRISLIALLGISKTVEFEFHAADWLGNSSGKNSVAVLPEIEKLSGKRIIYFYGTEEKETLQNEIDTQSVTCIPIEGGHHFGGKYDQIAKIILQQVGM